MANKQGNQQGNGSTSQTVVNIGIVGAGGRMGREIARLASTMSNVRVVAAFDKPNSPLLGTPLQGAGGVSVSMLPSAESASAFASVFHQSTPPESIPHVLIDFTSAQGTLSNMGTYHALRIPVVIGSTGVDADIYNSIENLSRSVPVFYSANMSIGVHIMNKLTVQLARLAQGVHGTHATHATHATAWQSPYDFEVVEAHHKHKMDAPSGTAMMLAKSIVDNYGNGAGVGGNGGSGGGGGGGGGDGNGGSDATVAGDASRINCVRHGDNSERTPYEVGVQSVRGGGIAGEHTVLCIGENDRIEVTHRAMSRTIFAEGALQAAVWLALRHRSGYAPALHTMDDLLA